MIAERIKEARKIAGLKSAYQLSERMKQMFYSDEEKSFLNSIQSWECGRSQPTAESLKMLCEALDCDAGFLLGLQEEPRISVQIAADAVGVSYNNVEKLAHLPPTAQRVMDWLLDEDALGNFFQALNHWSEQALIGVDEKKESVNDFNRSEYYRRVRALERGMEESGALMDLFEKVLRAAMEARTKERAHDPFATSL